MTFFVSDRAKTKPKPGPKVVQQERLNAALRANLNKRKQQARKRGEAVKKESHE